MTPEPYDVRTICSASTPDLGSPNPELIQNLEMLRGKQCCAIKYTSPLYAHHVLIHGLGPCRHLRS